MGINLRDLGHSRYLRCGDRRLNFGLYDLRSWVPSDVAMLLFPMDGDVRPVFGPEWTLGQSSGFRVAGVVNADEFRAAVRLVAEMAVDVGLDVGPLSHGPLAVRATIHPEGNRP